MAAIFKRELDITVLRIYLDHQGASRRGRAVFRVESAGEQIGEPATVELDELGLPPQLLDIAREPYREATVHLPDWLIDRVRDAVLAVLMPGDPLWLELAQPSGNLAVVDWEGLLQPPLGVPVLRLPHFTTWPAPPSDALDVVLCASSPMGKSEIPLEPMLATISAQIRQALPARPPNIHIFADADVYSGFHDSDAAWVDVWDGARLYNPAYATSGRSSTVVDVADQIENRWLKWISAALDGRSVDIVHFVCHGYLSPEHGAIALAGSPAQNADAGWACFVGPRQLDAFLTRNGAASIAFSSPPRDYSRPGLRLLADHIARRRPGSVFVHDYAEDQGGLALREAYRLLFSPAEGYAPPLALPAVAISCHPGFVHERWRMEQASGPSISEFTNLATLMSPPQPAAQPRQAAQPAWVAASARYLERAYAQLMATQPSPDQPTAAQQGAAESIEYLADAVLRHAEAQRRTMADLGQQRTSGGLEGETLA